VVVPAGRVIVFGGNVAGSRATVSVLGGKVTTLGDNVTVPDESVMVVPGKVIEETCV